MGCLALLEGMVKEEYNKAINKEDSVSYKKDMANRAALK